MRGEQCAQALRGIERQQFVAIRHVDQDWMSTAAGVFGLDELSAAFPFLDQSPDDLGRHGWMIYQGDN